MIYSKNGYFVDEKGRILLFRGCNFSADAKIPVLPNGATHNKESLNREKISFVGRPCRLEEADEHFERMKNWGFNFLRFLITWEAIEPHEPGVYDIEYIRFIKSILKKAADYGFYIYIDPHQDVYSRFSGGDGAPWWTFDKVGIDVEKIGTTFSALFHKDYQDNFPSMIWPTNYNRYAAATMFTLFFGGKDFAPHLKIDGQNVQDYLQTKYINAIKQLAKAVADNKNIIGFGSMNEPSSGYIGITDLSKIQNCSYAKGYIPTGFQSMILASGFPTYINKYNEGFFRYKAIGKKLFNKEGISLFKDGAMCPWRAEGVWDIVNGKPILLKKDYFSKANGKSIDFANDYLKPFIIKFQQEINKINKNWFTIVEGIPHGKAPTFNQEQTKKMIHGFHWYDGLPMVLKVFFPFFSIRGDTRKPVFGKKNIIKSYFEQIKNMKENTEKNMGNMPCLLGEFGLPFDIFNGILFKIKNYKIINKAISMYYDAIDKLLISSTIWTYCVNNNHKYGDNWNKENFSIYCKEDFYKIQKIKNKKNKVFEENIRVVFGILRPYPVIVNGIPLSFSYDTKTKKIILEWKNDDKDFIFSKEELTIIFIPKRLYKKEYLKNKYKVKENNIKKDEKEEMDKNYNLIFYYNDEKIDSKYFETFYEENKQFFYIKTEYKGKIKIVFEKIY